jgi:hypothetical protein
VRRCAGRAKETLEPVPSKGYTGVMAVISDVRLGQESSQRVGQMSDVDHDADRVPRKCRECPLSDISIKLRRPHDTSATRRILLNIRVADEWVVLPAWRFKTPCILCTLMKVPT